MYKNIVYILLFLFSISSFSQKDSLEVNYDKNSSIKIKKFDKEQLDTYKENKDFDYAVHTGESSFFSKLKHWIKRVLMKVLNYIFGTTKAVGVFAFILKLVPYLVLIAIIVLITRLFLRINSKKLNTNQIDNAEVVLTEEADIIKNADISALIKKAVNQNNYRLAVRYYYLMIIQKLEEKEMIDWEQQKTNEDYIKEIEGNRITKKFKELTHLYDFIWYGNFEINELEFVQVAASFNSLNADLK